MCIRKQLFFHFNLVCRLFAIDFHLSFIGQLGEVYFEILEEFRSEGFYLTSTEEVAFDTIMRVYQEKSRGVALLQRQLIEAERQQNLFDERKVYVEVCNS